MKHRIIFVEVVMCVFLFIPQTSTAQSYKKTDSTKLYYYGYVDFFSIYTDMSAAYPDYQYSNKNITFSPYPNQGYVNRNSEQPFLYLAAGGMNKHQIGFRTQFSFLHSFNGFSETVSKELAFRSIPSFEVYKYTPRGIFSITAGDCTEKTFISSFTLSGQSLITHPFERLPWDWHQNTFDKYQTLFSEFENPLQVNGLSASQGFVVSADSLFRHWGVKFFYGRTNFSSIPTQVYKNQVAMVSAGKIYHRFSSGMVSLNAYYHAASPFVTDAFLLRNFITSLEYKGRISPSISLQSEIAHSKFRYGPTVSNSMAFNATAEWNDKNDFLAIKSGAYVIPYDFVGKDNAILNTNKHMTISGIPGDQQYNLLLFINPVQSPTVLANNRIGFFTGIGTKKGKLRFHFEQALSREIKQVHDSITFFHHDNSFTRSRFTPWLQGSGPYGRIGSRYRFTTETIPVNTAGERLVFYAADLKIKYSTPLLSRTFIAQVQPGYRFAGTALLSASLFQSWFTDVSVFYNVAKKWSLLAFTTLQNNRQFPTNELAIDQKGVAWGLGVDVEVAKKTFFYLRYKRFSHADNNWVADHFRGEEITTELKVFF